MQIPPNFPLHKVGHSRPSINARNLRLMVERNRLSAILTHFCGRSSLIAFGAICGTSSPRRSMSTWVANLRSGDAGRSVLHPGTLSGSVGPYEWSLAESNCSALSNAAACTGVLISTSVCGSAGPQLIFIARARNHQGGFAGGDRRHG